MTTTYVTAAVAGAIGAICVTNGSTVKAGDIIIVQIATKTETNVFSPVAGKVNMLVKKGADVKQGDHLAEITS